MMRFSCFECRASALITVTNLGDASPGKAVDRLVFNKYGDTYFLGEIWNSQAYPPGTAVVKSKTEREVAGANPEVARINVPLRKPGATLASIR
jgi:hypothetical protein